MIEQIKKLWDKHGFIILVVISIITIIILSIFKIGCKGTWSDSYTYNQPIFQIKNKPVDRRVSDKKLPKESKGEFECRRVLQKLFNKSFPNIRPDFLRNPVTGNFNLELDCYDDSLKLAVEYNGIQHYKYVPYFHKNKEAFRNQCYRDELKRRMCRDYGANLIEVPYTVKIDDIENYLIKNLKLLGYII
jgi:hypothetical protein